MIYFDYITRFPEQNPIDSLKYGNISILLRRGEAGDPTYLIM
jgi:hypothetical protein